MKTTQLLTRSSRTLFQRSTLRRTPHAPNLVRPTYAVPTPAAPAHCFSTIHPIRKGLQPDTSDPAPPQNSPNISASYAPQPAALQDSEYHEIADQYMNTLLLTLEEKIEDGPQDSEAYDVEFSAGVLTLRTPKGTYVVNKQPPNKQIWLSSPVSGPKRFDWVVVSEGQDMKAGTEVGVGDDGRSGGGKWVYLRDGTTLTGLLSEEVGVDVVPERVEDVEVGKS